MPDRVEPGAHLHAESLSFGPDAVTEDIEGIEAFTLRSVGIDIGSSTSHTVFSRLKLRREGAALSTRFDVTERQILYQSRIMLTPYLSGTLIDTEKLKTFIHRTYEDAGFTPAEIDTGAVVITGEALKKENARPILEFFAQDSGKFICASAGPNHEALLAAHGSGAVALSKARGATVLNVDIGGGTSKLSIIRGGVVTGTAAINIGARLIAFDGADVLVRIEEPAKRLMGELGYTRALGERITDREKGDLAQLLARTLFELIVGGPLSPLAADLMITAPLHSHPGLDRLDYLVFSGGVSEYVYGHDRTVYGDLGLLLGQNLREQVSKLGKQDLLQKPVAGIRATVIGAGEYTIQASGNTSYISDLDVLPAFGLQVVRPVFAAADSVEEAIVKALAKFDLPGYTAGLALALSLPDVPTYAALRRIAEGIAAVLEKSGGTTAPLFLVLDLDVAKSLGGILKEELKVPQAVVAVDSIDVGDLDYIDIGRPMGVSEVLPVTVKSLLFPSDRPSPPIISQT